MLGSHQAYGNLITMRSNQFINEEKRVKDRGAHVKDHQAKVKRICIVCDQTFKKQ